MLTTLKAHPYITAGALLAGVALIVIARSAGGGTGAAATLDPSSVAAATDLQKTQLQIQAAGASQAAQLQGQQENDAAQIALAQIAAKSAYDVASLQANVATNQITTAGNVTALQSSLEAQTNQAALNADVAKANINATAAVQTTQTVANALVQQAAFQTQTSIAAINAANECHGIGCWF